MQYLNEFDATMQHIQGKWKIMILYQLYDKECCRFNELQRHIVEISHKTLTNQLRELERDELIERKIYNVVPPHVEYKLTPKGKTLIPVLDSICDWALNNVDPTKISRLLCD